MRLEQNYRSTQRILRVADRLIGHNRRRKEKRLFTENDEGRPVRLITYATHKVEAEAIAQRIARRCSRRAGGGRAISPSSIASTPCRGRWSSRCAIMAFRIRWSTGWSFISARRSRTCWPICSLLNNPRDNVAFLRIINTPPRGIGRSTIEQLVDHAGRKGKSLLEAAREAGLIESLNKRAAVAVAKFVAMYRPALARITTAGRRNPARTCSSESGYRESLAESDDEEDQERLANIEELLTAAREFDEQNPGEGQLEDFLEEACLVNDTDAWEVDDDRVTLMTLHASKGLEFPVVFIDRPRRRPAAARAEPRIARANWKKSGGCCSSASRGPRGIAPEPVALSRLPRAGRMSVPSQFLMELPQDELESRETLWSEPAWVTEHDGVDDAHQATTSTSIPMDIADDEEIH